MFRLPQYRGSPYEIELGNLRFLKELSVANIQGIGSIPAIRLQRKLGSLSTETLNKIKQALGSSLEESGLMSGVRLSLVNLAAAALNAIPGTVYSN
jgi:hypothetical protein